MAGPVKPKFRDPCNGCGVCCALELCDAAAICFGEVAAPCPALEWEDGRAWCGMVRHPLRHLLANFAGADATIGETFALAIGAGQGCSMPDEETA